jgi:CRP/FNR family transcriptional regulator
MNTHGNVVRLKLTPEGCGPCGMNRFCLAAGLAEQDFAQFAPVVRSTRPLQRGQSLFRCGDRLTHLYLLKAGSMKVYTTTEDGLEQIIRLHLPGDVLGLDAMQEGVHTSTAVALETTTLCMVPWEFIDANVDRIPSLRRRLLRLIGKEIANENERIVLLGQRNARERLAAFLIYLSNRFERRGFSAREFRLSMSRQEIANYLALAIETVSRLFSAFQAEGVLSTDRRFVRVEQLEALRSIATAQGARAAG